jgi:hypothetical protein
MKKVWVLLVIVGILVGAYLVANSVLDARVRTATAAMKAAGHPTTAEDLDPAFSAGSESTAKVIDAAAALLKDEDLARLKYLDTLGWREDRAGLQAFLKDKSRVYELAMQAATMPPADFGMSIRDGFGAKITTSLQEYAGFRLLLRLQARELAESRRPDSALKALEASAALALAFAEPVFIYHLVSMLGMDSVFTAAAQVAPKAGVPAIERLIARFQGLGFKADEYRALQAEAVITQVGAAAGQMMAIEAHSGLNGFLIRVLKPCRSYARARFMEVVRGQLEVLPKPWFEGHDKLAQLDSVGRGKDVLARLAGTYTANVSMFYERAERMTAWRDIAVLGLRALILKRRTGRLPARIEDFSSDAPLDRFSGKPYVYRVLPDGFVVYSVGTDQKDDNGTSPDDLVFKVKL